VVVTVGGNIGRQTNMYMLPGSAVGAALHAINKELADARAAHAIRFHILNPGPTRTERLIGYAQMLAKQSGISVEQVEQQLVKDAPQHRIASHRRARVHGRHDPLDVVSPLCGRH